MPNDESVGATGSPRQAEGHEEAPTPGGAGARAAGAGVALTTAGQDSRRRATSQVIQRSTAKQVAVRSIGLTVHNPSGNARSDPPPQMTVVIHPGGTHRPVAIDGGRSCAEKARIPKVKSITSMLLYSIL